MFIANIRWLVRDMLFRDQFLCFEFTNSKFRVYKLEILSLQTRNFEFSDTKFRVYKFEIFRVYILEIRVQNSKFRVTNSKYFKFVSSKYFEFTNLKYFEFFAFVNSNFRVCKLEISSS